MYESSNLTKLCKEVFGGNSIGMAIFTLRFDDPMGSSITLKLIKMCQQIINFPVTNDNRSICLLRRFRLELKNLRNMVSGSGNEAMEKYQAKLEELEKRMIDESLDTLKYSEDKKNATSRIYDLRDKYNLLVKDKIELQKTLLTVEEEKVSLAKALIEFQIENAKLNEALEAGNFENQNKLLKDEAETLELHLKLEKTQKNAEELQQELSRTLEDKKELEIEFVALKKNYLNKQQELEDMKRKNEQVGIELVNLINENETLSKQTAGMVKNESTVHVDYEKALKKITSFENETAKLKEEIIRLNAELERSKAEKLKAEISAEKSKVDYESMKTKLDKDYATSYLGSKPPEPEPETINPVKSAINPTPKNDKDQWEKEKFSLTRRTRELSRKLEAVNHDLEEYKLEFERATAEKIGLAKELELLHSEKRIDLTNAIGDKIANKLIASYKDSEYTLKQEIDNLRRKNEALSAKCKILREYSREVRAVAEDVFPEHELKPSVLAKPEPGIIKEEKDYGSPKKSTSAEIDYLKDENERLKREIQNLNGIQGISHTKNQSEDNTLHQKILEELKALKGDNSSIKRPGTASADVEALRKERNQLLEENLKLKKLVFFL